MKTYEKMKLSSFFTHLDTNTNIHVIEYNPKTKDEEDFYEGDVWGCPWWVADMYLDTDVNGEAIYAFIKDGKPYIGIYVREE